MPVTKSAKKKLKQDKKRTKKNLELKKLLKGSIKNAAKKTTKENLSKAFKIIDKASKAKIIHPNKAARVKSNLAKKVEKTPPTAKKTETAKKVTPQKTAKKRS